MSRKVLGIACAALIAGCAPKAKMLAQNYVAPQSVAILPMSNRSNDLKGPEYIRKELLNHLSKRGYHINPIEQTDEELRTKLGITDGGQLTSTSPDKVAAALGVDAVIYGDVLDFKFLNIGFYQNKFVEANFKMFDKTGAQLWEDQRKATKKELQLSPKAAGMAMARGVAEKAVGNMFGIPLYQQVQQVVSIAARTLPVARK